MRAVKYVLVEAEQEYNNEVTLSNGVNIVVNTTIESVANINRMVKVISAPEGTILQEDDILIIHHNILRKKNNVEGEEVYSDFHIKDNIYFVPPREVFAYKRDGKWNALDPYVFVSPIKKEKKQSPILELPGAEVYVPNWGKIEFINEQLQDWGLKKGDQVFFKDHSEYEFNVEGQLLYRMKTTDILGKS